MPGADGPGAERISVIVRCHNYGQFLGEAVESVDRQSRPADQIVVVDDGSTDDTATVVQELAASRPHLLVVSRKPARGPAASFNDGVLASSGDLIVALDADDVLSPDYLEQLAVALSDPRVSIAYAGKRTFGAVESVEAAKPFDRDELLVENFIHVSAMFRRQVFDATGGFRPELDRLGLEDWEFWVHAVERGAVAVPVPGPWLGYRRHGQGSRNSMARATVLRAHLLVWRLHPKTMRARHLLAWMTRSGRRNRARFVEIGVGRVRRRRRTMVR